MATVTDRTMAVDWEPTTLVPPELVDPFLDDDDPGLDDLPPAPAPDPLLSFPQWLGVQAAYYRSQDGTAAAWLAEKIDDLAGHAEMLHATCGTELDVRLDVLDADRIRDAEYAGWNGAMGHSAFHGV